MPIFRNDDERGGWLHRPNTILVDSQQLESGEGMSDEFKKIAAREIEEFKAEYRDRFPGRDAEKLTDEDLLREVMNTVGKAGKLGEHVKCVVSVSMLTEGWDANTVTHILGVRAFGTQLLCEQVVGRGLRRMSYAANEKGRFEPEYAEVYGVPFSFIPCSGSAKDPEPGPLPTRVRALESRIACEIHLSAPARLPLRPGRRAADSHIHRRLRLSLSTADIPTETEMSPSSGRPSKHTLDDLKRRRPNEVAFLLAKLTLEKYFRDDEGNNKPWLFPQLLAITKRWLADCVKLKDRTFLQLLLLIEFAHDAADRIYKAIVASTNGAAVLKPILRPYDTVGSTRYVDFDTARPVYATRPDKCHISHVVADTESWEQKMAQTLEDMDEVVRYVKNHNLGFTIPYTLNGEEHNYIPDFIACIDDGQGADNLLNLLVEVTGEKKKDKAAKVATARTLWVPAVNNLGGFGRWAFVEIADPWDAEKLIRGGVEENRDYDGEHSIMAKKKTAKKAPAPSNRSATRTSGRTSPPRNCATSWPTRNRRPRPCSIPATRRSIRSLSGRARTSRTARTWPSPWCRSTSRRRSTPRRSSTICCRNATEAAAKRAARPLRRLQRPARRVRQEDRFLPPRRSTGRTG